VLDIAPALAAAEEMLFNPEEMHDARRALARAIDRVAGFLEMPPLVLAMEIERCHRNTERHVSKPGKTAETAEAESAPAEPTAEPATEPQQDSLEAPSVAQ
jgi:hypothetical protein